MNLVRAEVLSILWNWPALLVETIPSAPFERRITSGLGHLLVRRRRDIGPFFPGWNFREGQPSVPQDSSAFEYLDRYPDFLRCVGQLSSIVAIDDVAMIRIIKINQLLGRYINLGKTMRPLPAGLLSFFRR